MKFFKRNSNSNKKTNKNRTSSISSGGSVSVSGSNVGRREGTDVQAGATASASAAASGSFPRTTTKPTSTPSSNMPEHTVAAAPPQSNNPFDEQNDFVSKTENSRINNNDDVIHTTRRRSPSLSSSLASSSSSSSSVASSSPITAATRYLVTPPTTSSMALQNLNVVIDELSKQDRRQRQRKQQQQQQQQQLRRSNSSSTSGGGGTFKIRKDDDSYIDDDDRFLLAIKLSEIESACHLIVESMAATAIVGQRHDPRYVELQCEGSRAISLLVMTAFGDDIDAVANNEYYDDGENIDVHLGGGSSSGHGQNNNVKNYEALVEAVTIFRRYDVLPTLFKAMERYPDEDELQDHAMAAVAAVSRFWGKYYSYFRSADVVDDDGRDGGSDGDEDDVSYLEIVLEAMDEYPAHERIPSNGLVILSNVAMAVNCRIVFQEKRQKLKQQQQQQTNGSVRRDNFPRTLTNAIPTVLQILKDYRDNAEMYEKGLSALVHLTSMNPEGQMILSRQPQAVSVLIRALSAGSSDEKNDRFGNVVVGVDNGDGDHDEQDVDDDGMFASPNYTASARSSIVDLDDDYDLMIQKKNIRLFSLQILQNISSHPSLEVKGKIILQGGVASIVRVLREMASAFLITVTSATSSETDTIIACLRTLVHLSSMTSGSTTAGSSSAYDENRRVLAKTSTKIVLAIVRQYNVVSSTEAYEILIQSFIFFRNISMSSIDGRTRSRNISPVGAEILTSNGGISTILVCMRQHTSHAMIQIQACSTIANLLLFTNNSPGGYDVIQSFNAECGISTMFETIRLHQANQVVLEQAFSALYYLVCSRDLLPDQKQQLLLEENLLVILATIQQYVDESESLCVRGCGILLLLSAFAGSRNSTAKDAIVDVGGIDVVLATMRRHGLNKEIQEYGSGFLRGICLDSKYHHEFVEKEGISAIVSAMVVHPAEAAIQAYGCDCFIHIANANSQYKKLIEDADGLSLASNALSNHASHRTIQSRGTALVRLLSSP